MSVVVLGAYIFIIIFSLILGQNQTKYLGRKHNEGFVLSVKVHLQERVYAGLSKTYQNTCFIAKNTRGKPSRLQFV